MSSRRFAKYRWKTTFVSANVLSYLPEEGRHTMDESIDTYNCLSCKDPGLEVVRDSLESWEPVWVDCLHCKRGHIVTLKMGEGQQAYAFVELRGD